MAFGVLSVRESVENCSEGREERASTCGMKRMVGNWLADVAGIAAIAGSGSTFWSDCDVVGMARVIASAELLTTDGSSTDSDSAVVLVFVVTDVEVRGLLLSPLPGIQPFSALCMEDVGAVANGCDTPVLALVAVAASVEPLAGTKLERVLVRPGEEVERVRTGGRAGGGVSERW